MIFLIFSQIYDIISTGGFMDYSNKVILITGAYRGIGRSLCDLPSYAGRDASSRGRDRRGDRGRRYV